MSRLSASARYASRLRGRVSQHSYGTQRRRDLKGVAYTKAIRDRDGSCGLWALYRGRAREVGVRQGGVFGGLHRISTGFPQALPQGWLEITFNCGVRAVFSLGVRLSGRCLSVDLDIGPDRRCAALSIVK